MFSGYDLLYLYVVFAVVTYLLAIWNSIFQFEVLINVCYILMYIAGVISLLNMGSGWLYELGS